MHKYILAGDLTNQLLQNYMTSFAVSGVYPVTNSLQAAISFIAHLWSKIYSPELRYLI